MFPRSLENAIPFLLLGIAFLFWLVLPAGMKRLARNGFHEFKAPAVVTASALQDLQTYWSLRTRSKRDLIEAGQELARTLAAYEIQMRGVEDLRTQNLWLRRLLGMPEDPGYRYEVARVARRELSTWWHHMVIRKGWEHGVVEGAGVIFEGGVVGRVRTVHRRTAVVELITSPGFQMAARFSGDRRPVRFVGGHNPSFSVPRGVVRDVPADIDAGADEPAILEATPLGGIFPAGIRIGEIRQLEPGPDGLFQTGEVWLNKDLFSVEEVTVLIPLEPPDSAVD